MTLQFFDKNYWYSVEVQKGEWNNPEEKYSEDVISFEINNVDGETPKKGMVPEETTFLISIEDAKHLIYFLQIAIDNISCEHPNTSILSHGFRFCHKCKTPVKK